MRPGRPTSGSPRPPPRARSSRSDRTTLATGAAPGSRSRRSPARCSRSPRSAGDERAVSLLVGRRRAPDEAARRCDPAFELGMVRVDPGVDDRHADARQGGQLRPRVEGADLRRGTTARASGSFGVKASRRVRRRARRTRRPAGLGAAADGASTTTARSGDQLAGHRRACHRSTPSATASTSRAGSSPTA